jgi:hypothetical protein
MSKRMAAIANAVSNVGRERVGAQRRESLGQPMPRRMRDKCRQHDRAGTLGDAARHEPIEDRYSDQQRGDLRQLDPHVERGQRGDEMTAGELQRVAQGKRKPESASGQNRTPPTTVARGAHPPRSRPPYTIDAAMSTSTSGGNQRASGASPAPMRPA